MGRGVLENTSWPYRTPKLLHICHTCNPKQSPNTLSKCSSTMSGDVERGGAREREHARAREREGGRERERFRMMGLK